MITITTFYLHLVTHKGTESESIILYMEYKETIFLSKGSKQFIHEDENNFPEFPKYMPIAKIAGRIVNKRRYEVMVKLEKIDLTNISSIKKCSKFIEHLKKKGWKVYKSPKS